MEVKFELNEKQQAVLKEIQSLGIYKGAKDENDICRLMVVSTLIALKQQSISQELSK